MLLGGQRLVKQLGDGMNSRCSYPYQIRKISTATDERGLSSEGSRKGIQLLQQILLSRTRRSKAGYMTYKCALCSKRERVKANS